MILTKQQVADFQIAAGPLMKFLDDYHPHMKVVVTMGRAEILESCAAIVLAKVEIAEVVKTVFEKHAGDISEAKAAYISYGKKELAKFINTSDNFSMSAFNDLTNHYKVHTSYELSNHLIKHWMAE